MAAVRMGVLILMMGEEAPADLESSGWTRVSGARLARCGLRSRPQSAKKRGVRGGAWLLGGSAVAREVGHKKRPRIGAENIVPLCWRMCSRFDRLHTSGPGVCRIQETLARMSRSAASVNAAAKVFPRDVVDGDFVSSVWCGMFRDGTSVVYVPLGVHSLAGRGQQPKTKSGRII